LTRRGSRMQGADDERQPTGLRAESRGLSAAAAFLTLLPESPRVAPGGPDVARGAWAFPAVGALLGCVVGAVALTCAEALPPLAAGALGALAGALATGGLHLDGLADSADGLGGRSPERALEIMRDHSVGAYGSAAISLDLVLRTVLIAALLEGGKALAALVVAGAVARAAVLVLPLWLPYARKAPGLGAVLSAQPSGRRAAVGIAIAAVFSVAILGLQGLPVLACTALIVFGVGLLARRRLGGVTGDVLGASIELSELATLTILVALS
jgi:adenosylcobinamide-GDP ribazoletransferase